MTMDPQSRHIGGGMHYDHMPFPGPSPNFTNPWGGSTSGASSSQIFPTSLGSSHPHFDSLSKQQAARGSDVSLPPHTSVPSSAPAFSSGSYQQQPEMLIQQQELLNAPRNVYEQSYSSSTSPSYAPTSAPYNLGSFSHVQQPDNARRLSHTYVSGVHFHQRRN